MTRINEREARTGDGEIVTRERRTDTEVEITIGTGIEIEVMTTIETETTGGNGIAIEIAGTAEEIVSIFSLIYDRNLFTYYGVMLCHFGLHIIHDFGLSNRNVWFL